MKISALILQFCNRKIHCLQVLTDLKLYRILKCGGLLVISICSFMLIYVHDGRTRFHSVIINNCAFILSILL